MTPALQRRIRVSSIVALFAFLMTANSHADNMVTSAYTTLDFDRDCARIDNVREDDPEAELGGTYRCAGYQQHAVIFKVGDLRESIQFGALNQKLIDESWESFGPWNAVQETFEWRLRGGKPFAVIHRVAITNIDPDTGFADPKREGSVLVISQIAQPENNGYGCAVGLVDARANANANVLAREVADGLAGPVPCTNESPPFTGKVSDKAHPMTRSFPTTN